MELLGPHFGSFLGIRGDARSREGEELKFQYLIAFLIGFTSLRESKMSSKSVLKREERQEKKKEASGAHFLRSGVGLGPPKGDLRGYE